LPDEDLGKLILELYIGIVAERRGIPPNDIPHQFKVRLVEALQSIDTGRPDLSILETVLQLAAVGQLARAGRVFRQYMIDGAINIALLNNLFVEVERKLKGPKAGGAKTAKRAKSKLAKRNNDICAAADEMIKSGVDPRSINSRLARRFKRTAGQIRRIRRSQE
jgi:hypothetical protein